MENILNSIDIDIIGTVNGINVPRLNNLKLIQIAKFLGIDGMRLYNQFKDVLNDKNLSEQDKWITILMGLPEEKVVHILSILLGIDDKTALKMDPVVTLEIILLYVEKVDLNKAFTVVRTLAKKLFNKEIPDLTTQMTAPMTNGVTS